MGFRHNFLIGLGGVGGAALKAFRAETVERAGEYKNLLQQGRRFEYLYLDSNAVDVDNAARWEYKDQHTGLVQGTQALLLSLPINATAEGIANHPQVEPWIGENGVEHLNETSVLSGLVYGALQRRRYGRVLAAVNADAIRRSMENRVCELSKGLVGCDRRVTFHVFASLGGGTGSGCLVDVLTLLPQLCHDFNIQCKIVAYLFVGGAEAKISKTGFFHMNEYATLRDVNALMANRYRPYRTLMPEGRNPFHHNADPIDAVYISTGENGSSLSAQVKDFAASCFDMISIVSSVDSSTCRAFSGEDLYQLESGEESVVELDPRFNKDVVNQHFPKSEGAVTLYERSYRFQTLSTVRAKHPSVVLHGVLACALGVKVYDRWLKGGLLHRSSRDTSLEGNADIYAYGEQDLLLSQLDAESREKLSGEHKTMLDSYKKADRSVAAFAEVGELNAAIIRRCLEQTAQELTGGESVNACRRLAQDDRNTIIDMLEKRRRGQSDAKGESWGIGNIRDYLCEVRAYLQKKIAQHRMPGCEELGEGVQRICSARASLGFMKKCFTFASRKLYQQLREECSSSLERCCDARLEAFRNLRNKFLLEMVQKDIEAYEELFRVLESQQQAARERRDAYLKRLPFCVSPKNPELHIPDKNIYLWNSENLEQHLDFYGDDVRCDEAVSQAVSACEDQWSTVVGRSLDSGRYADGYASKGARTLVDDLLREESGLLWGVSDRIHAELCDQQRIERLNKVYYETIYDYLADKDAQFRNMLLGMLVDKTMDRSAAIAPCEHGGGTVKYHDIQSDPMCSVCLGMLSAGRLHSSAAAAVHADMSTRLTTSLQSMACRDCFLRYEHNIDGTEIRIARVEYNMPLRFFCVMEYLDQCYKKAQNKRLTEALYYANIDDAGMHDPSPDRPDLLPELDPIQHTAREELRKQLQEKNTINQAEFLARETGARW